MNRETFNKALDQHPADVLSAGELNEALEAFPYCQSLHLLRSKVLQDEGEFAFEPDKKRTAIFSNNRSVFFDYLFSETLQRTVKNVERKLEETAKAEEGKKTSEDALDTQTEPGQKEETAQQTTEVKPPIKEKPGTSEEKSVEAETTPPKDSKEQPVTEPEKEKSTEGHSSLYKQLEREIIKEAVSTSISQEAAEQKAEAEPSDSEGPKPKPAPAKQSFSAWLKHLKGEPETEPGSKYQRELIDKFIQNDPQITPKKSEFFSPVNQAKLSLAENEDYVTETLAKLYAKQGNIGKAIQAYETLMLKNPEKRVYFASQIKTLKKQKKPK